MTVFNLKIVEGNTNADDIEHIFCHNNYFIIGRGYYAEWQFNDNIKVSAIHLMLVQDDEQLRMLVFGRYGACYKECHSGEFSPSDYMPPLFSSSYQASHEEMQIKQHFGLPDWEADKMKKHIHGYKNLAQDNKSRALLMKLGTRVSPSGLIGLGGYCKKQGKVLGEAAVEIRFRITTQKGYVCPETSEIEI